MCAISSILNVTTELFRLPKSSMSALAFPQTHLYRNYKQQKTFQRTIPYTGDLETLTLMKISVQVKTHVRTTTLHYYLVLKVNPPGPKYMTSFGTSVQSSLNKNLPASYRNLTTTGGWNMGFAHNKNPLSYVSKTFYCDWYEIRWYSLSYLLVVYTERGQIDTKTQLYCTDTALNFRFNLQIIDTCFDLLEL